MTINVDKLEKTVRLLQQVRTLKVIHGVDGKPLLTDVQAIDMERSLIDECAIILHPQIAAPVEAAPVNRGKKGKKPAAAATVEAEEEHAMGTDVVD